jgi:hypothetical protein
LEEAFGEGEIFAGFAGDDGVGVALGFGEEEEALAFADGSGGFCSGFQRPCGEWGGGDSGRCRYTQHFASG